MEITIKRGVSEYELSTLMGKLAAHRVSTGHTHVFFIVRSSKKLGNLDTIDLKKLRLKIEKALGSHATIGLLLTDAQRPGILHKPAGHERSMKTSMRSDKQLANALF